jgi:hypothetical protein
MTTGYNDVLRNSQAFRATLRKYSDGTWRVRLQHGNSLEYQYLSYQSNTSAWTHIAIVRSGSSYRVYKDGVLSQTTSFSGLPAFDPAEATQLLYSAYPASTTWILDDVAIWEQALSPEMIAEICDDFDGDGDCDGRSSPTNPRPLLNPIGKLWNDPESPSYQGDDPDAEQGLGLAVKIAETASKHAAAVETFAGEQLGEVYGGCYLIGTSTGQQRALERAASGLRYVGTAEALARDLRHRAAEVPCTQNLECTYAGGSTCGAEGLCLNADGVSGHPGARISGPA